MLKAHSERPRHNPPPPEPNAVSYEGEARVLKPPRRAMPGTTQSQNAISTTAPMPAPRHRSEPRADISRILSQLKLSVIVGSPTNSRLNSAIRAAIALASFPKLVVRNCFTTALRPSRHFLSASGPCVGVLYVPSSLRRRVSGWVSVLCQLYRTL